LYFKEQRFEKAKASTLASTHKVELPDTGLLDSLSMYFRITNAADMSTYAPTNIHHHITKIEVIGDTDKTLFSMIGECAIAKAYRKMHALPPFKQDEYNGKSQDLLIPIFFGRRYKDGHYALDLSKWDKVELQVTNDFTTNEIVAASLSMETRLCTIEDSPETYAKFLKQWEYDATKPDADADYVRPKLPTSGLLRALMIQLDPDLTTLTAEVAEDPVGDSYNWKLWFKDRALTIYDHRPRDLMRDEHRRLGIGHSHLKPYPSTTKHADYHWAEVIGTAIAPTGDSADATLPSMEDNRNRYQKQGFAGGVTQIQAAVLGVGLFHTFEVPFYLVEDIESAYLNLATYKPVEVEWYGHKDDNTHRMILEKPIGQGPAEYA
jgi:hypothetical protein